MTPTIERFLEKIIIAENKCWVWTGAKDKEDYGRIRVNNTTKLTHRFIYEYYYGQICPDLTIDHLCRNRTCVNPLHLEQVTQQINASRGINWNSIKTHCKNGHLLSGNNLRIENGKRRCKTCVRENKRITRKLKKLQFS